MKQRLFVLALFAILTVWLFAPALSGAYSFVYRDAGYYYHPLFEFIRSEWGAGRFPLWNPYENTGVPLLAENTSSVLYPGKLLFALPLDYIWLYNAYIVAHVVLAAGAAYALARHLRTSVLAAAIGALSYAFSANVLFQTCNVIFLVGAAWLPLAILLADRTLRQRRPASSLGLGVVLALVVLGGDPHMAYNIVLLCGLYALLLWLDDRRAARATGQPVRLSVLTARPVLLGLSLATAGLCAAVQVLPTLEAGPYSARAKYDAPRNIYELAETQLTEPDGDDRLPWYAAMLGSAKRGHHKKVYYFSVAPWRVAELFWPNVTGRAFPTNRRWLAALRSEFNIWVPSLYLGLAPLVLGLSAWSLRRRAAVEIQFLSWMALLSVVGGLGSFGVAWFVGQALGETEGWGVGEEVGGLYWWLNTLLPKYVQFRYPAKLWVPASLALSMLAACGWRDAWESSQRRVLLWLAGTSLVSIVLVAAFPFVWRPYVEQRASTPESDRWMGPFDWSGAAGDAMGGLQHAALLAPALLAMVWAGRRHPRYRTLMQLAVLGITGLELAVAQEPLLRYAPSDDWRYQPQVVDMLPPDLARYRVYHQDATFASSWSKIQSPNRFQEWLLRNRDTLSPKFNLRYRVALVEVLQAVAGHDYTLVLDAARLHNYRRNRINIPDPSVLDLLAARAAIVQHGATSQIVHPRVVAEGMSFGTRRDALPRAWIAHNVEVIPEFHSRSPRATFKFTQQFLFPDHQPRDWHTVAVVESDTPVEVDPPVEDAETSETCTLVDVDPQRVEIEVTLASRGLVILADQFYPGWELTVETDGGPPRRHPILRTNRVQRGAVLPAGKHRLVYRYRPKSVLYGAIISTVSTLALLVAGGVFWWRGRSKPSPAVEVPADG